LRREDGAKGRGQALKVRRANAAAAYADLTPLVAELRAGGLSLRAIADGLNADGYTTRRGAAWNPVQVRRVLSRAGGESDDRRRDVAGRWRGNNRPAVVEITETQITVLKEPQ